MRPTPNKWETLHNRAKEFIQQPPLIYYGLSPAQIPNAGGIANNATERKRCTIKLHNILMGSGFVENDKLTKL